MSAKLDKRIDAYIANARPFAQPLLEELRAIMHEGAPGLEETIKWSMPFFVYGGVILGNMSAFKAHCSFGLWGLAMDEELRKEGIVADGAMGSFGRLASLEDLPPRKKLVSYVRRAARLIDDGVRTKSLDRPLAAQRVVKPELSVPPELQAALKRNKTAAKVFEGFAPSCKREYVDWIADAKREETKTKRVEQAVGWIAEGKRRHWKHEGC